MPNALSPSPESFARRLLDYETTLDKTSGAIATGFPVCERLRGPLGKLVGIGGFRSLLSRALALAGAEVPWLRSLHIKADGSFEGMDELLAKLDSHELAESEVALVSHIFGLLVTFIGPTLTLELLQDIWPKMDDLNS